TSDEQFWSGCKSCVNYSILTSKDFKNCLCTAMLYKPSEQKQNQKKTLTPVRNIIEKTKALNVLSHLTKLKQLVFFKIKTNPL
ncbi:MAG: GNAT family N-acetyltransferase, partial [Bacteroidota bacterium]